MMSCGSFKWEGNNIRVEQCGELLSAEASRALLTTQRCCFNCHEGAFDGGNFFCQRKKNFVGIAGRCEEYERK